MKGTFARRSGLLCAIVLAAALALFVTGVFGIDASTNKMIVEYADALGWKISPTPDEAVKLTIPNEFDAVYETYNAVQKNSGFDLEEFKGKRVSRYSYRVLNHRQSKTSEVYLGVIVFEGRIIAGEISSTDMNGFMHALTEISGIADFSENIAAEG